MGLAPNWVVSAVKYSFVSVNASLQNAEPQSVLAKTCHLEDSRAIVSDFCLLESRGHWMQAKQKEV